MKQQFVCHTCCIINKLLFVDKKPKDPKTGVSFEIYAYRRLTPQKMHDVISTYFSQKKAPKASTDGQDANDHRCIGSGQRVSSSFVVRFDQGPGRTGSSGGRIAKEQAMDFFELVGTGTPQSVQAAINQGADMNARDMYDRTPLMLATEYNQNPEMIITLLDAGGDVNARDNYVETPLMQAARFNQNPEVITTLLMAGADAKAKNKAGKTAFDNAQANEKLKGTDAYRKLEEASK